MRMDLKQYFKNIQGLDSSNYIKIEKRKNVSTGTGTVSQKCENII